MDKWPDCLPFEHGFKAWKSWLQFSTVPIGFDFLSDIFDWFRAPSSVGRATDF